MPRVAPVTRARRSARRRELLMVSALTLRQPWCQEDPALNWGLLPSHGGGGPFGFCCAPIAPQRRCKRWLAGGSWATFLRSIELAFHRACVPSGLRPVGFASR